MKNLLRNNFQLLETSSDSEIVGGHRPGKEEDTRTHTSEPDRMQKVEDWLNTKQTCGLNGR